MLVLALAALYGCGGPSGALAVLPAVERQEAASITVVRVSSFVGGANSYVVALDGLHVLSIGSGEHAVLPVRSGEHTIAVKCFGGWTPTWKENSIRVTVPAKAERYIEVAPSWASCAEIRELADVDGRRRVAESTRIEVPLAPAR